MHPIFIVIIFICLVVVIVLLIGYKSNSEKEYEANLKKSLEDEFIIDPSTGAKITLAEAESGHWIAHDNEYRTVPEKEISKFFTEEEKQLERALNYLRESKLYKRAMLTENQLALLESTKMLSKYYNWTYSDVFQFEDGYVFLPAPELQGLTYYEDDYKESHLMFWKTIKNINGHYFLREKSVTEKIFDRFRSDDDLQLTNYESFTFQHSFEVLRITKTLENFEGQKGLEIEFHNDSLFIKTMKLPSIEDIQRLEKIVNSVF